MADARREARLVEEHRDELRILGELRGEPLDRDGPREADLAEEAAHVHRRHAARRDLVVERVAADDATSARHRDLDANTTMCEAGDSGHGASAPPRSGEREPEGGDAPRRD